MIKTPGFFQQEKDAPLMQLNRGYLQDNEESLARVTEKTKSWPGLLGLDPSTLELPPNYPQMTKDKDLARIFVADAERTFRNEENRQRMIRMLNQVSVNFGGYHQGLGFVASFLLLFFEERVVIAMLTELNKNPKYIPGYWQEPAVPFARDAYVFHELMASHCVVVKAHFEKMGLVPNMYATKWLVGLCVHVLPFEALFRFLELFFTDGYKYLMGFALELASQLQPKLLATNNISIVLDLLKLDAKQFTTEQALSIVEGARRWEAELVGVDWEKTRADTFEKHLRARLEAAERAMKRKQEEGSDDEIVFSDETDEEDSDDESDSDEDEVDKLTEKVSKVNV
eukprot:TRINITY_DN5945_c0_g1_i2.p1 TRINITY_DN5945_c0_g1~~TRINITY_DN5945_c0_g1_i2.p1  ORF type:complete len:341 (-),score=82.07 TRINITY_DN5945_c0_g1_i2:90-1112(-)